MSHVCMRKILEGVKLWVFVVLVLTVVAQAHRPTQHYKTNPRQKKPTAAPVNLRKNPHLSHAVREHDNLKALKKPDPVVISEFAKKDFCLNVRGWALPTQHVFVVFEDLLNKSSWAEAEQDIVRYWLDRGFGYAMSNLVESTSPRHMNVFKRIVQIEYKGTNVICPFSCSYKDFHELQQGISLQDHATLQEVCRPNCHLKTTPYNAYDFEFCTCLIDDNQESCDVLTSDDRQMIVKSKGNQETLRRDYEFRNRKNPLRSESVELLENQKHDFVNAVRGLLAK